MRWESVEPPAGLKLSDLTSAPTSGPLFCAAAQSAEGPVLVQYSLTTGQWEHYPMPTRANYNLQTGRSEGSTGNLQDLSGGLSFSPDGKLFVASNEPGKAAAIYRFEPSQESSTQGEWQALPPLRGVQWRGNQAQGSQLFASRVDHLRVDEEGGLWAQLTAPDGIQFSDIHVAPAAAHP